MKFVITQLLAQTNLLSNRNNVTIFLINEKKITSNFGDLERCGITPKNYQNVPISKRIRCCTTCDHPQQENETNKKKKTTEYKSWDIN